MSRNLQPNPEQVKAETAKAELWATTLAGEEPQLILGMVEGETECLEALDRVVDYVISQDAIIDKGKERLQRITKRKETYRAIARSIMEMLQRFGISRLERAGYTASMGQGQPSLYYDEKTLPEKYWKKIPDEAAIKAALKEGIAIPDAYLGNSAPVLRITTK
jgi:hypothetical protein